MSAADGAWVSVVTPARVLVVDEHDTCRAPLLRVLLAAYLRRRGGTGLRPWAVASAGTHAEPGRTASPDVAAVAAAWGLELADHRARAVTSQLLAPQDLVLATDPAVLEDVRARVEDRPERCVLLPALGAGLAAAGVDGTVGIDGLAAVAAAADESGCSLAAPAGPEPAATRALARAAAELVEAVGRGLVEVLRDDT